MRQRIKMLAAIAAAAMLSCTPNDHVTAPSATTATRAPSNALVPAAGTCSGPCLLFNNTGPLWSALANPDSLDVPVAVAAVRYAPALGDSVALLLTADSAVMAGLNPDEIVDVSDGIGDSRVALRNLTTTTTVWRFGVADTTTLRVTINRALATGLVGRVTLTASSGASVVAVTRPWLAPVHASTDAQLSVMRGTVAGGGVQAGVIPGCGSQGVPIFQDGTYCGVNVHFFQAVPADAFLAAGAEFQSDPGHGVSNEITVTFSQPVASVTVTAYDPTFAGNLMSAYDSTGHLIGTVPFPGNDTPGTLTTQTGTLSGAIESVHLVPAPLDYVAYAMTVKFSNSALALHLIPDRTGLLPPVIYEYHAPHINVPPEPSSRGYRVQLLTGSSPVPNAVVTLSLASVPNSGGHQHDGGNRPPGSFAGAAVQNSLTVTTDATGSARFTLLAPEFAGTYILGASTLNAQGASDTVTVGRQGLQLLVPDANITLTGFTSIHPGTHYATPQMQGAINALADSVFAFYDQQLGVNDESLELGGILDTGGTWMPPHYSHRKGRDADIRTRNVSLSILRRISEAWKRIDNTNGIAVEGDHWHLRTLP